LWFVGRVRQSRCPEVLPRWWPTDGVRSCPQRFADGGGLSLPAETDGGGHP
jgi:hypothetical protein